MAENGTKAIGLQELTCILDCFQSYQLHDAKTVTCHKNGICREPLEKRMEICRKKEASVIGAEAPNDFSLNDMRFFSRDMSKRYRQSELQLQMIFW